MPEKAKDSHTEEGKKETESDSTVTHCTDGNYVYPALVDLIIEPKSTSTETGTGTDIGTLTVTGIYENPGIEEASADLHFENDNRLKLALRKGSTGRVSHFYI